MLHEDVELKLKAILEQEKSINDEIIRRQDSGVDEVADLEAMLSDLDEQREALVRKVLGAAEPTPPQARSKNRSGFPTIVQDPDAALEPSEVSADIDDISKDAAKFAADQIADEDYEEEDEEPDDIVANLSEAAPVKAWVPPKEPETPGKADPNNPVAMNQRLRREMGAHAADFLDEYGQATYKHLMEQMDKIKFALDLGKEDPDDGVTTLREQLLIEVGQRGVKSIEPVFEEWRFALVKKITDEIKDKFQVESERQPTEIPDDKISNLLGIDHMETEIEGERNPPEPKPEPKPVKKKADGMKKKKLKKKAAPKADGMKKKPAKPAKPAPAAPVEAKLEVARGPVSMSPRDFTPSGAKPVTLE